VDPSRARRKRPSAFSFQPSAFSFQLLALH
jgi:hypothetical protein